MNKEVEEFRIFERGLQELINDNAPVTREQLKDLIIYGFDLTDVNTSEITDMSKLFQLMEDVNGTITNWDTSNVTDMHKMFDGCVGFDQPLVWDTSSVTNMSKMFREASSFNQPLHWDTSNVTNMSKMFCDVQSFRQVLNWDLSSVKNMSKMFHDSTAHKKSYVIDIGGYNE